MIKLVILVLGCFLSAPALLQAQVFGVGSEKVQKVKEEQLSAETPAIEGEIEEEKKLEESEKTDDNVATISRAQIQDEADSALRESLRDSFKNDELKERIKYLDNNNYMDRIMMRRKLAKEGYDFKTSEAMVKNMDKANVNPEDDEQMNEYLFKRYNVEEPQESNVE